MADLQLICPISEDWLKSVGFKWHTVTGHDPDPPKEPKHWLLWMGGIADPNSWTCDEDLGLELSAGFGNDPAWFCWLRADTSHRYSRFLHIRHIRYQHELIQLIEALSGAHWNPENHLYGRIFTAQQAESIRKRDERLDIRIAKSSPWSEREKDDSAGRQVGK